MTINELTSAIESSKLCIFCAGKYGYKLYYDLKQLGIVADFFCDNDITKCGSFADGKRCISFDTLELEKNKTFVIVATQNPKGIIEQLHQANFSHFIAIQEIDSDLYIQLGEMRAKKPQFNIDYSSSKISNITHIFKSTMSEACEYYENLLTNIKNNT